MARKELVALSDGFRESAESWADLLRDCRRRGMRAPVLAVGDGALGFWKALREVFPNTRRAALLVAQVRRNVLAALPKSAHPGAKAAMAESSTPRTRPCAGRGADVRGRLRREMAEGGREDHRPARRAAGLLRFSGRALGASAHHQPDRVDVRDRPAPAAGHQGPRLPRGRHRDGVQAHGIRPGPLAGGQRAALVAARPCRSDLRDTANSSNDPPVTTTESAQKSWQSPKRS